MSIYRRPLSRDFTRYEPWQQYPFNVHYTSYPPEVNIPDKVVNLRQPNNSQNTYGTCNCRNGSPKVHDFVGSPKAHDFVGSPKVYDFVESNCNEGYVAICDGPYGNRCQCVDLKTGDSGCGNKNEGFGVWCPS